MSGREEGLKIESGAGLLKAERSCLPQGSCELNCAWLTGSKWPSKTNTCSQKEREEEEEAERLAAAAWDLSHGEGG